MFTLVILDTILRRATNMTSNANKYQARVYEAYRAWCKVLRDDSMLDTIAESFDVVAWDIERAHRTALDLD